MCSRSQVKKTTEATLQTIQDMVTIEDYDVSECFQHSRSTESVKSTVSETYLSKPSIAKRRANQQETEQFYFMVCPLRPRPVLALRSGVSRLCFWSYVRIPQASLLKYGLLSTLRVPDSVGLGYGLGVSTFLKAPQVFRYANKFSKENLQNALKHNTLKQGTLQLECTNLSPGEGDSTRQVPMPGGLRREGPESLPL